MDLKINGPKKSKQGAGGEAEEKPPSSSSSCSSWDWLAYGSKSSKIFYLDKLESTTFIRLRKIMNQMNSHVTYIKRYKRPPWAARWPRFSRMIYITQRTQQQWPGHRLSVVEAWQSRMSTNELSNPSGDSQKAITDWEQPSRVNRMLKAAYLYSESQVVPRFTTNIRREANIFL